MQTCGPRHALLVIAARRAVLLSCALQHILVCLLCSQVYTTQDFQHHNLPVVIQVQIKAVAVHKHRAVLGAADRDVMDEARVDAEAACMRALCVLCVYCVSDCVFVCVLPWPSTSHEVVAAVL